MKLADTTDQSQTESIAFQFELPHAPDKVWRALTDPGLLSEWLLPVTELRVEQGAAFRFTAPPQPGWDGTVDCRFTEIERGRKLSYAWVVGEPGSEFFLDTVVTFTLEPTDAGTRMTLVQSGFKPDQRRNFGGARYGWKMMGERLVALLEQMP